MLIRRSEGQGQREGQGQGRGEWCLLLALAALGHHSRRLLLSAQAAREATLAETMFVDVAEEDYEAEGGRGVDEAWVGDGGAMEVSGSASLLGGEAEEQDEQQQQQRRRPAYRVRSLTELSDELVSAQTLDEIVQVMHPAVPLGLHLNEFFCFCMLYCFFCGSASAVVRCCCRW